MTTHRQFVRKISNRVGLSVVDTQNNVSVFIDELLDCANNGGVRIGGLGKFYVNYSNPRLIKPPKSPTIILIKRKKVLKFIPHQKANNYVKSSKYNSKS